MAVIRLEGHEGEGDRMTKRFTPYRTAHAVVNNKDLTEGRGPLFPQHICELEATARRVASKAGVQGGDATVIEVDLFNDMDAKQGGGVHIYGPVYVVPPTKEDKAAQERVDAREAAEEKAKAAGLTEEDIKALRGGR